MNSNQPGLAGLTFRTIVVHTVTYFLMGVIAFFLLDYPDKYADPKVTVLMRSMDDPWLMAGPLFQPLRGILFALAFYPLRDILFREKKGWLVMWWMLVVVGILSPFGAAPGSIEGMVYTVLPLWFHLFGLPEILLQALLFSVILYYWVNHQEKECITWILVGIFFIVLLLTVLGLLTR